MGSVLPHFFSLHQHHFQVKPEIMTQIIMILNSIICRKKENVALIILGFN
jgi:hypothetical protein